MSRAHPRFDRPAPRRLVCGGRLLTLRCAAMRIDSMLADGGPVFSFEFFPPKTPAGHEALLRTIGELQPLRPGFVSVTYGAMGSNRGQVVELVDQIRNQIGIEAMAHLSCTGHTRDEIAGVLDRLAAAGLENVLALRGDPPPGQPFRPTPGGFAYASDLADFIRGRWPLCIGGAAYPEMHPDAPDADTDLANLLKKARAGANFLVTQLFFDNADYFTFVERARGLGINVPIVPGIMPMADVAQIRRIAGMCGAKIPEAMASRLSAADGDATASFEVGVEWALEQCRGLLKGGAPGVHFYTLNKSSATREILSALRSD